MADEPIEWDEEALKRLEKAPFFVRRIARAKTEKAAREQGLRRISAEFVEKIRRREMDR